MLPEVPEGRHNVAHGACPDRREGEAVGNKAGNHKKAPPGAALQAYADECCLIPRMLNRRGKAPCGKALPAPTISLIGDGMRLRSRFHLVLRGYDGPEGTDRKEAVPAWSATIGGEVKQAEEPGERARSVFAGNALEVHVAAHYAMRVADVRHGNGPGIESRIAAPATPGAEQRHPDQIILHTLPPGTTRTIAMTNGTQQLCFTPGGPAKRIREG
jgi:hypothetical protein